MLDGKKEALKNWFSNKENLILLAVILFAFAIRLYYFVLTQGQPLWWDEAEYMLKAKNIALGTPETGWSSGLRPILFPFLSSIFFLLGLGEFPIRLILVIASVAGIFLLYLIGKELFNHRVALIAAFLMSVFYIDIFYTTRLLVDVPQILFVNLALFLFVKNFFGKGSKKLIWLILPIILIGAQFRFTVGLVAITILIFLLVTQGFSLIKNKDWYISLGLGILCFVPYLIYAWIRFGNPLFVIYQGLSTSNQFRAEGVTAFDIFMQYIHYLPSYTPIIFFIAFIVGALIVLFNMLLSLDKLRVNSSSQRYLFLVLSIILPLIYFGFFVNHFEDRYLFMVFPAIFILSGFAIDFAGKHVSSYNKIVAIVLVLAIIGYGAWGSLQRTDDLIKSKITSYESLRSAGLWLKENTSPGEAVISSGMPQLTYYSERPIYPYPLNESELFTFKEEKGANFMILTMWERTPEWTYKWPEQNPDKVEVVQAYFLDPQRTKPSTIIYHFK